MKYRKLLCTFCILSALLVIVVISLCSIERFADRGVNLLTLTFSSCVLWYHTLRSIRPGVRASAVSGIIILCSTALMVIFSSIKYVFEDFGILFPALALIVLLAVAIIIQHIINRKHDKKEKA